MKDKLTIHIDMSSKLHEGNDVGVAFLANENKDFHRGLVLKSSLLNSLEKTRNLSYDYPRLYAICIYWILKEEIEKVKKIIICDDYPFFQVEGFLRILFTEDELTNVNIVDLFELRNDLQKKVRSSADNIANAYRKRGNHPNRLNKGRQLFPINITYKDILSCWDKIDSVLEQKNGE